MERSGGPARPLPGGPIDGDGFAHVEVPGLKTIDEDDDVETRIPCARNDEAVELQEMGARSDRVCCRVFEAFVLRNIDTERLQLRQIRALLGQSDTALCDKTLALAIPRITETVERYHGDINPSHDQLDVSFVQRAFMMRACIAELEQRGMLSNEKGNSRENETPVKVEAIESSKES